MGVLATAIGGVSGACNIGSAIDVSEDAGDKGGSQWSGDGERTCRLADLGRSSLVGG
jgi:hypothetical protein